jgi:hypothetical protein
LVPLAKVVLALRHKVAVVNDHIFTQTLVRVGPMSDVSGVNRTVFGGTRGMERLSLLLCLSLFLPAAAPPGQAASSQKVVAEHDGQHDFDFEIGNWKTHLKVLVHPLTGSTSWMEFEGTSVVHKIWDGRANIVELEVDGAAGHKDALSLRLYNPESHQWSLNTASAAGGTMSVPTVGSFKDGRGEFYDMEPINGRMVLVRNVWSDIAPASCHFEQAFSADGGKTWETNWIADDTRMKDAAGSKE